jgi:hypothetical protein
MRSDGNFRYMTIQQSGGTRKTIERGVAAQGNGSRGQQGSRAPPQGSYIW